jgi:hypothetical protein
MRRDSDSTNSVRHYAINPRRRSLLQRAGVAAAIAGLPKSLFAAETVSPIMATLSNYMSEAAARPLPAEVQEKAKHHVRELRGLLQTA